MDSLKRLIGELKDKKEAVNILQKIEKELLCKYCIKIGEIIIMPILVEAYYRSKCFVDGYTHDSKRQYDRFKKIYIHETGYGGLDLCLSDSKEYALSFLIKKLFDLLSKRR